MKKRKDETSYRETAFGIIPRSKLIPLEIEGVKRAWDFVLHKRKKMKVSITPQFIKNFILSALLGYFLKRPVNSA